MITSGFIRLTTIFKILLLIFIVLKWSEVLAQPVQNVSQVSHIRNIIPPSPNASALGRFGEVPVSYSTGVPNISIPLYQLANGKLDVPVTLNYHSGGFKVNENASWVGFGWVLNAGGTISRTRIGFADENNKGYLNSNSYMGSLSLPINLSTATSNEYAIYESLAYGQFDTEPDIFNFNFLGRNGRFFLDANGNVHQLAYTDLKIQVNQAFTEWTIIDENGTVYTFANVENTHVYSGDDPYPDYVSSWNLTKIKTSNNEVINFVYGNALPPGSPISSVPNPINIGFSQTEYSRSSEMACEINPPGGTRYSSSSSSSFSLKSIESDQFILKFLLDPTERQDGDFALQYIELYDKLSNRLIKKHKFTYEYFQEGGGCLGTGLGHEHNNPTLKKRLKLKSLTELSAGNQSGQQHQFYYNETALPEKCSYDQDHWGYYNGARNNSLIPYVTGYPISSIDANRETDSLFAQAGILTKIVYPTGGHSRFEYESNRVGGGSMVPHAYNISDGLYSAPGGTESITEFTVSSNNDAVITLELSDGGYPVASIYPQIYILNSSNVVVHQWVNNGAYTKLPIYLEPGTYKLKLVSPDTPESTVSAVIQYTGTIFKPGDRLVGGLRIKNIINYESNGTDVLSKRSYKYEKAYLANPFSNNEDYVTLYSLNQYIECAFQTGNVRCNFRGRASFANYSLGSLGGGHIIYGKVTEEKLGNGRTIYEYSVFPVSVPMGFPQPPSSLNDWKSGQLLKKSVYKENNQLVKRDVYDFDYLEKFRLVNYKIGFVYDDYCRSAFQGNGKLFDQISSIGFENLSGLARLKNHKEVTYSNNGLDSVMTNTTHYYDNPLYTHSNRTEINNSNGKITKIITKYPQDSISGLSTLALIAKNSLVSQFRIKELLEQETYSGADFLSKTRINYSNQWVNSSLTLPHLVEIQPVGFSSENIVRSHDYDGKGNLLTQSKERGALIGYHWDVTKQYPIAEIKNGAHNEFFYNGFEDGTIGSGIAYTGEKSTTNPTVSWIAPNNRSYVISYWYLSNGIWRQARGNYNSTAFTMIGGVAYDDIVIYPADAEVTTYTYESLVGMKTRTDTKGQTTYYDYDDFKRLKSIKDQDGNVIKSYRYNYKF